MTQVENNASYPLLSPAYQENISSNQNITSTYLIDDSDDYVKSNLFVYDTESGREEKKVLKILKIWEHSSKFIIPLPNNELFIYRLQGFIIDRNYQARKLPPKIPKLSENCFAAAYYNRSIYCFSNKDHLYLSCRFNLDENRWSKIASMLLYNYSFSNNAIFNRNILISGKNRCNLLLYSIDIDSFSIIPYQFTEEKRKILISIEERLYLIECGENSWVYESEIGNMYVWKKLTISMIDNFATQIYCSYNKGVYIAILHNNNFREYFKFDLDKKALIEVALYSDNLALKRVDDKLETIECYNQAFKLNSDYPAVSIKKGCTLYYIAKSLEIIEDYNNELHNNPKDWSNYWNKGLQLHNLGWYLEAINCYNEAINIKPEYTKIYHDKGNSLYKLKRYNEAIECYNESIELQCCDSGIYFSKGKALDKLNKDSEAMEYYNKAINFNSSNYLYFCYRAKLLSDLGHEEEAIDDFNKAYNLASNFSVLARINKAAIENLLELLKVVSNFLENVMKFKDELKIIKDENLNNPEILYEIEKKETEIKEKHWLFLNRVVKCLKRKYKSSDAIEKIKKEVAEHQKVMVDMVNNLGLQ